MKKKFDLFFVCWTTFFFTSSYLGCLPNPEKNESVLKAFAIYAIKQHKQSPTNKADQSILSIFKQATTDGIKSKEAYALAVRKEYERIRSLIVICFSRMALVKHYWKKPPKNRNAFQIIVPKSRQLLVRPVLTVNIRRCVA